MIDSGALLIWLRKSLSLLLLMLASTSSAQQAAIDAILELPRTKASHYVEASLSLIDLGQPELATPVVQQMLRLQLSETESAELVAEVGSARLMRLGREVPRTAPFVEACLQSAEAEALKPERLMTLVNQLQAPTPSERIEALSMLRKTGLRGVDYCLTALTQTNDQQLIGHLREALVALEPVSLPALYSALDDPNETIRTQAAYALGRLAELQRLRSPLAAAMLGKNGWEPGPTGEAARWAYEKVSGQPLNTTQVSREIDQAIVELLKGSLPLSPNLEGRIAWPAERGQAPLELRPRELAILLAAPLAEAMLQVPNFDAEDQRRALLLGAEAAQLHGQQQKQLEEFNSLSTYDLNLTLRDALKGKFHFAAIACCQALGQRGDLQALQSKQGQASPLASAVESSDASVRFAAVEAIMQINPTTPYAGSSRVADTLLHLATGRGSRRVVVASPQHLRAGDLAGLVIQAGYEASALIRGFDTLEQASRNADVEFVLLDLELLQPNIRETLFRLRRTPTTAALPIAILAPPGRLEEARSLAHEHGGAAAQLVSAPRLVSANGVAALLMKLEKLSTAPSAAERLDRSEQAQQWIEKIIEEGPDFYRLGFKYRPINN